MASDYLISKWKMWFKWLDINKDDKLDCKDMKAARTKFIELNNLEGEQKSEAMGIFENWWNDFIFLGKLELTEADFIAAFNEEFKTNRKSFIEKMQRCFQIAFDVVDINREKMITEDEFIMGFRTSGHENMELNRQFFQLYNPNENGLVPVRALVDSWVQFTTSEDMTKRDLVKSAVELGV